MKVIYALIFSFLFLSQAIASDIQEKPTEENTNWSEILLREFQNLTPENIIQNFETLPFGTIATVNEDPITLQELESLVDMNSDSYTDEQFTLDDVLNEYSIHLFELIRQKIIAQEVKQLALPIDYSQVEKIEEAIRASYGEDFESEIQLEGISLTYWRKQLRAQIEQEALQHYIAEQVELSSNEIINYYSRNKEKFLIPERYNLIMFSSSSESEIKKAYAAKVSTKEEALNYSISLQEGSFAIQNIPEEWQKDVQKLKENDFSTIKNYQNAYRYVYLKKKTPEHIQDETKTFLLIEQILSEEKLEQHYQKWLLSALEHSSIFIAPEFLLRLENKNNLNNSQGDKVTP